MSPCGILPYRKVQSDFPVASCRPLYPSQLLRFGPQLCPLLANPKRKRTQWTETIPSIVNNLG